VFPEHEQPVHLSTCSSRSVEIIIKPTAQPSRGERRPNKRGKRSVRCALIVIGRAPGCRFSSRSRAPKASQRANDEPRCWFPPAKRVILVLGEPRNICEPVDVGWQSGAPRDRGAEPSEPALSRLSVRAALSFLFSSPDSSSAGEQQGGQSPPLARGGLRRFAVGVVEPLEAGT